MAAAAIFALVAGGGAAERVAAQLSESSSWGRSYYNLERSHLDYPFGRGLVFEAQIAPQLVVTQNVHSLFADGTVAEDADPHWAYSFSVSPMIRLRMINTASQPVRTPSYMPHGVFQLFRVRNLGIGERGSSSLRRGPYEVMTLQLRLSHHSNGQDGCLYTTQQKVGTGSDSFECVFEAGTGPDPATVNLKDGSFSKNFLRVGYFYRRLYLPADLEDVVRSTWYVGATVESHDSFLVDWIPGRIPADQAALYGTWRWRLLAGGARRATRGRWSGGHYVDFVFERYPDASDLLTKWAFSAEYARTFDRFGGWGLYARYFTGQDYYNLGFGRKISYLSLGLAWLPDRFEELGVR